MARIVALIPARSGSKSIKDKNIQIVSGRPLLSYTIAAAFDVPEIDDVFVSTDSSFYADLVVQYGSKVVMRPTNISGDNSKDIEFVLHFLSLVQKWGNDLPQYIIHLRPNVPLREPKYISDAITTIKQHKNATALRSVHPMPKTAYKHFEIEDNFLKCIFTKLDDIDSLNIPQQENFPITYDANGYVDVLNVAHILEEKKIHGKKVLAFEVPRITDIDTIEDLDRVKYELEIKLEIAELYNQLFRSLECRVI